MKDPNLKKVTEENSGEADSEIASEELAESHSEYSNDVDEPVHEGY